MDASFSLKLEFSVMEAVVEARRNHLEILTTFDFGFRRVVELKINSILQSSQGCREGEMQN